MVSTCFVSTKMGFQRWARKKYRKWGFDPRRPPPTILVRQVYHKCQGRCFYCSREVKLAPRKGIWEVDHYYPRCQGGKDDFDNLVVACFACNRSKGAKIPQQSSFERCLHLQDGIICRERVAYVGAGKCEHHLSCWQRTMGCC
jgi:hypothetical protein